MGILNDFERRLEGMIEGLFTKAFRTGVHWIGRCIVIAAWAIIALGALGGLLNGMHVEGKPSAGIGDLTWSIGKWSPDDLSAHADLIVDVLFVQDDDHR